MSAISRLNVLRNGAVIISRHILADNGAIVLANFHNEYVTWRTDEEGHAFWGHYFGSDFEAASANFLERAASN